MGRATIKEEIGEGRYTIEIDYGDAERTRRLAAVDMRLFELGLRQTWQSELLADIEDGMPSLRSELDALILAYVAATKAVPRDPQNEAQLKKQIDAKTADVLKQASMIQNARNALALTELQIKSAQLERGNLEQLNVVVQQGAWCADYSLEKTGNVATIDINGEGGLILVAPGAPAPTSADGALVSRELQSPEQVFWNAAVLPGWQKWKPMYRSGTITALDTEADTADVELDDARSTAQNLDINKAATLKAVPVKYMDCNSLAFGEGDKVVVKFKDQDNATPEVVGFVSHPKTCNWPVVHCSPDYYRYIFENKLADSDPSTMTALMSASNYVWMRTDSGPWEEMQFIQTISASGGRVYNQYRQQGAAGTPRAVLLVGYNFYLSRFNDLTAPAVDGVSIQPPSPAGVPPNISDPTIHEFKIVGLASGRILFNAAVFSDPGLNAQATAGQAKAPGGIKVENDSLPVTVLDYALNQPEE